MKDVLSDILDTLDLRGALYFNTDFTSPWAVKVPQYEQVARFHLVIQGRCFVKVDNEKTFELMPGDLILIPRGVSHILSYKPDIHAPPLETVLKDSRYKGNGVLAIGNGDPSASTQLICGHFSFRKGADHPILRKLPNYLVTSGKTRSLEPLLDDTLRLLTRRIFTKGSGSDAAVIRLSETVFIELLRIGINKSEELVSLHEAFTDKHISHALEIIHSNPENFWSVQKLAQQIGMSRSRFAERFNDLLGTSPIAYLSDWRIQKALSLLDNSKFNVQQIASQIGYKSPAAFTRAFSLKLGITPTEYRQQAS